MAHALTTVALIATGSWIAAMLLLISVSRPGRGVAAIHDGWPVDPPALAALLLLPHRRRAAVAARATLLDLIARGVLVAETDAEGHRWLRITGRPPGLRPYERHVWDQVVVRTAQGGGRTPADRLDMGSTEHANAWYTRFTQLLEADGRQLGLVAPRIPVGIRVVLWLALLGVFAIACAAAIGAHAAALIGFLLLGYRLISLPAGRLRRLVPRGAGVDAAAGCRALRTVLTGAEAGGLPDRPGDRRLAYAVAVGVAEGVADPFTPTGGDAVWTNRSRHGGGEDPDHFAAAIDDGTGGPAIVYEIDRATHDKLRLYHWLRLVVTPKLGYVRSSEILADEPVHD